MLNTVIGYLSQRYITVKDLVSAVVIFPLINPKLHTIKLSVSIKLFFRT